MVLLKDIARDCGVSIATASKALNDHKDISKTTKERIQRRARELGYMSNAAACALKTKRTRNIGVLFVDPQQGGLAHEFFSSVFDGIRQEAERNNYDITFINNSVGTRISTYLQHCLYRSVDGVVIASADFNDPMILELINYTQLPVVTLDHMFNGRVSVMSDNTNGMNELTRYVLKKGHRKLAFIHGEQTAVTLGRIAGYYRACEEFEIEVNEKLLFEGAYHDPDTCYELTKKVLAMRHRPSCIFFPDDYSYLGGLKAIIETGLKVPSDISAVGYDGIPLSKVLSPVLTTWRQNAAGMGRTAVARLIGQITHPKTAILDRVIISGELQEGGTVADISDRQNSVL